MNFLLALVLLCVLETVTPARDLLEHVQTYNKDDAKKAHLLVRSAGSAMGKCKFHFEQTHWFL